METLTACPICSGASSQPFLDVKDHTVSRETFSIVQCSSCGFRYINPRPSIDQLGKYYDSPEYISHSDTSKGFINSTYQSVKKYTLLKKLQLISKYFKTGNLLDIGSGTGDFLDTMQRAKWNVVGVEPSADARARSIDKFKLDVRSEEQIQLMPDESFDVITMWHVLEHVPDLNKRVDDLKRLLRPNGLIIIAVPNCNSADAKKYGRFWAAYDVPRHLYHFTPKDIRLLFSNHQMKVNRVLPMIFDSFYVALLSEKYKNGGNIISAFWSGFMSNLKAMRSGEEYSSQIYLIKKY